eukprot:4518297-Pyramimonas_sp.AAC.2
MERSFCFDVSLKLVRVSAMDSVICGRIRIENIKVQSLTTGNPDAMNASIKPSMFTPDVGARG